MGRSILLSQLAQAEKVEEQYAIARRFDPFNAVANWQKAEGLVQEKALNARAIERVYADTSELAAPGPPSAVDPVVLEAQLAELRAQLVQSQSNESWHPQYGTTATSGHDAQHVAGRTTLAEPIRNRPTGRCHREVLSTAAISADGGPCRRRTADRAANLALGSRTHRSSLGQVSDSHQSLGQGPGPDEIVAPDESYKGVMLRALGRRPAFPQSALLDL